MRTSPTLTLLNRQWRYALCCATMLAVGGSVWAQAPSQKPLLSRDGGGVKPNIVLTLDDSGSMRFQHMPEDTVRVGTFSVPSPVGSFSVRMDPGDRNEDASSAVLPDFFVGTIAGEPGSGNYRQRMMRSPDTNTIYYNPEVRYRPWLKADGTRYPQFNPNAAPLSPVSTRTVDLVKSSDVVRTTWCFSGNSSSGCANDDRRYAPGLYYRLDRDSNKNFKNPLIASNYLEFDINGSDSTQFIKHPARTDCISNYCTRDEERQNFANWFTYYRSRILLTKAAVSEAFGNLTDSYRIGYGSINQINSTVLGLPVPVDGIAVNTLVSGVRDFNTNQKGRLYDWLQALPALGGTPLRRAMQDVGNYYSSNSTIGPWSDSPGGIAVPLLGSSDHKTCRRAYNIMVTDGYWNDSVGSDGLTSVGNQDGTLGTRLVSQTTPPQSYTYSPSRPYQDATRDLLADYAMRYWKQDLRPDLGNRVVASSSNPAFWQHMVNFTVGLGVTGTLNPDTDLPALLSGAKTWGPDKIDDLWHAAVNSRGQFFSAKDPSELASAIRLSVGQALERELREAGATTASNILKIGNRKYVPSYTTGRWFGDVEAFDLDEKGEVLTRVWSAKSKMPLWSDRNIVTWDSESSTAKRFSWDAMTTSMRSALGSVASTQQANFVNYLRGDQSQEGDDKPFRERPSLLGDFINSNPVLIGEGVDMGYSNLPTIGATYGAYRTTKASRAGALFVGANDGMLHAFRDITGSTSVDNGKEIFAFVPRTVYPNLYKLTDKAYGIDTADLFHQFFVNGPLKESDAYVRPPGTSASAAAAWRNYLLGSLGAGGRAVFALDVTDTSSLGVQNVMWEFSNSNDGDMGYVLSPIETGVLPNGQWVAVFGNGYASDAGRAVLYVLDLRNGTAQKLVVDTSGANGLGGVAVQRNANGEITGLYAGDLKGRLWKFDYSAAAASKFALTPGGAFFSATSSAGVAQPITQPPILYSHPQGGKVVVFGTGQLITEADANSSAIQSMYGVWDKAGDTVARPMTRSVLAARSVAEVTGADGGKFYSVTGSDSSTSSQRGWVVDLSSISGLRVIYPPAEVNEELVLMSSVAPAKNTAVCETSAGVGINFILQAVNGTNPSYPIFDVNGDDLVTASDTIVAGYGSGADGVDAIISSPKRLTTTTEEDGPCASGFYRASIQSATGQKVACLKKTTQAVLRDRVWRRILNPPIR